MTPCCTVNRWDRRRHARACNLWRSPVSRALSWLVFAQNAIRWTREHRVTPPGSDRGVS